MSADAVVSRNGDTELWVIVGEGWELPVLADPYGSPVSHYRLRPPLDCGITEEMLRTLDERIAPIRAPADTNHVIVKYEDLQVVGRKAVGITPGYYLKWPGLKPKTEDQVDRESVRTAPADTDAGKDFCAYLHRLTGVTDYPTLRLIWKAICQYGPRYMLEKRKPLNFGFCKIIPSPYRANWKGLLTTRFPRSNQEEVLQSEKFTQEMCNTVLAAIRNRDHICHYGLEVISDDDWHTVADAYEEKRRKALGGLAYAEFWRRSIGKLHPYLLAAFREWARAIRLPCGQLGDGLLFGGRPIIPWVPLGKIRPAALDDPGAGSVVKHVGIPHLKGPGGTYSVPPAARKVSRLPDLQPDPRNLRVLGDKPAGPALPEPGDEPDGTVGVWVPPDAEGQESGGNLLAEGDGI